MSVNTEKDDLIRLLLLLLLSQIFMVWLQQDGLANNNLRRDILVRQGIDQDDVDSALFIVEKTNIAAYALSPFLLAGKLLLIALFVQLRFLIARRNHPLRTYYRAAVIAEFIILARGFAKAIMMKTIPAGRFNEWTMNTTPLSLQHFFHYADFPVHSWFIIGRPNLFDLAWILVFSWLLTRQKIAGYSESAISILGLWTLVFLLQWAGLQLIQGIS